MNSMLKAVAATVAIIVVFAGCDNPETPSASKGRVMYYAVAGNKPGAENVGFFGCNLENGVWSSLYAKPVVHCTQPSDNGIVLFEVESSEHRLFGKCENGSIIPVPFPESSDPAYLYKYAMPPLLQLGSNGHHAVYPVERVLAGIPNPSKREAALVRFNCAQWKMNLIPVDSIVLASMTHLNVTQARTSGTNILVSPDGKSVWFTAVGLSGTSQLRTEGYALYEWTEKATRMIGDISSSPIFLEGLNERTKTILYRTNDQHRSLNLTAGWSAEFPYAGTEAIEPRQVCMYADAVVLWDERGIVARKASTGAEIYRIIDIDRLSATYGVEYLRNAANSLSISNDGKWVAFTLTQKSEPDFCDVFVVRGNGSELVRMAATRHPGTVVVGF